LRQVPWMEPIKLILDTNIGTDIDDAIALALAMRSPELDLIGVTTVNSDTALRARIARKLIQLEGRQCRLQEVSACPYSGTSRAARAATRQGFPRSQ